MGLIFLPFSYFCTDKCIHGKNSVLFVYQYCTALMKVTNDTHRYIGMNNGKFAAQ